MSNLSINEIVRKEILYSETYEIADFFLYPLFIIFGLYLKVSIFGIYHYFLYALLIFLSIYFFILTFKYNLVYFKAYNAKTSLNEKNKLKIINKRIYLIVMILNKINLVIGLILGIIYHQVLNEEYFIIIILSIASFLIYVILMIINYFVYMMPLTFNYSKLNGYKRVSAKNRFKWSLFYKENVNNNIKLNKVIIYLILVVNLFITLSFYIIKLDNNITLFKVDSLSFNIISISISILPLSYFFLLLFKGYRKLISFKKYLIFFIVIPLLNNISFILGIYLYYYYPSSNLDDIFIAVTYFIIDILYTSFLLYQIDKRNKLSRKYNNIDINSKNE